VKPKTWKVVLIAMQDGCWHSGQRLGDDLGLTRAAMWQRIEALRALGVPVESGPRGYRIPDGVYLPDAASLMLAAVPVVVTDVTDSTNQDVLERRELVSEIALWQAAGRGRRGRPWWGAPGRTLLCSVGLDMESQGQAWWGLSLAVGVVVAEYLAEQGVLVELKWPNDLYLHDRKLGGLLIELTGDPLGQMRVVAGLGLNLASVCIAEAPPMADLRESGCLWSDAATAGLIERIHRCLALFPEQGFQEYRSRYQARCLLTGKEVSVDGTLPSRGLCHGVDLQGQLIVETEDGLQTVSAGEVSVRWQ
jgi:BirA family transcriptional regulator, biotin operon repressor / biotin---[acetyl-CoA-carboxylase] ligase